ncbi:MAG: alpha/beta hydrolase [Pseudomonadota bacterium]
MAKPAPAVPSNAEPIAALDDPSVLEPVQRRAVFFIGGYDPKSPEAFFDRLNRETGRFETLWDTLSDPEPPSRVSAHITCQTSHTTDEHGRWATQTDFHFVCLDTIVKKDFAQPLGTRVLRYLRTFFDYVLTGTAFSFARHAVRFFGYFLYPFVMMLLGLSVSLFFAGLIANSGVVLAWLTAPIIFVASMASFVQLVAKRNFVFHLADLWSFSADYVHQRRTDIEDVLDDLAETVAMRQDDYDEIIIVGHSTGGALILDAAARALEQEPGLTRIPNRFWIMTVGSTALKVGLHPKAGWYRQKLDRAFSTANLRWIEAQCPTDVINFPGTNPAALMGLSQTDAPFFQIIRVRMSKMLDLKTYRRVRKNFFRLHYQFVYGNTRPYLYDFPAICFGPAKLALRAKDKHTLSAALHPKFPPAIGTAKNGTSTDTNP